MHIVSSLHSQTPNCRLKTVLVFIEKKNLLKRGPTQFKPVLFSGQLYTVIYGEAL